MRHFVYALIIILVCLQVQAAESNWEWVKVSNNAVHHWNIDSGRADVVINDSKFIATLYWKNNPSVPHILLKGSIQNDKLQVIEGIQASDYTGSKYSGTLTKTKYVGTINLSDGFGMIGITRILAK